MADERVLIRDATFDDIAAINWIYNEAVVTTTATFDTDPKSIEQQTSWLRNRSERHPVLVAEKYADVVGWASLSPWSPKPAYRITAETTFYVAEKSRGQGIGRQLKQAIIQRAELLGFRSLIARVVQDSEASLHLNKYYGFEIVGLMKQVGHKFGRDLDVYVLQKIL